MIGLEFLCIAIFCSLVILSGGTGLVGFAYIRKIETENGEILVKGLKKVLTLKKFTQLSKPDQLEYFSLALGPPKEAPENIEIVYDSPDCQICGLENDVFVLYTPCNHLTVCSACDVEWLYFNFLDYSRKNSLRGSTKINNTLLMNLFKQKNCFRCNLHNNYINGRNQLNSDILQEKNKLKRNMKAELSSYT